VLDLVAGQHPDIGVTEGGVMVWAVYAPPNQPLGALAGSYAGVHSSSVTAGFRNAPIP
jgi:hypothetical protein